MTKNNDTNIKEGEDANTKRKYTKRNRKKLLLYSIPSKSVAGKELSTSSSKHLLKPDRYHDDHEDEDDDDDVAKNALLCLLYLSVDK